MARLLVASATTLAPSPVAAYRSDSRLKQHRHTNSGATMEQNGVIAEPIDVIRETVRELRTLSDLTVERLEADFFLRRGVERSLQICVEAVIDIAHRLVSLLGEPPCASAGTALDTIAARGIIADAGKYRKMIQFRNLVVHRYDAVDNAVLVDIVRNHLGDLDSFMAEVAHANLGS